MRRLTVLLLLSTLSGCGGASDRLVPVTGTVRLDGHPLKAGTILFVAKEGPRASGEIVNGEILNVTTHQPNDGLVVGPKMVAVRPMEAKPTSESLRRRDAPIPQRYHDPATSKLTCEVVDGPNNLLFSLISEPRTPFPAQTP